MSVRLAFTLSSHQPIPIPVLHQACVTWALARVLGGDFILRVPDKAYWQQKRAALSWLPIDWDEGPDVAEELPSTILQDWRRYVVTAAATLQGNGHAYRTGDGRLLLRLPMTAIQVQDAIRGPLTLETSSLPDPELSDSDGRSPPWFVEAVVDYHMEISHAVRAAADLEDLAAAAAVYQLLNWPMPTWMHLPEIQADGERPFHHHQLSYLQAAGYLPNAVFNTLLRLGAPPAAPLALWDKWQARRQFQPTMLPPSPLPFDWALLDQLNRLAIANMSDAQCAAAIEPFLEEAYGPLPGAAGWLTQLAALLRPRLVRLEDAVTLAEWALSDAFEISPAAAAVLAQPPTHPILVRLVAEVAAVVILDEQTARHILHGMSATFDADAVLTPTVRAVLTGDVHGPPPAAIMGLIGKQQTLQRLASGLR